MKNSLSTLFLFLISVLSLCHLQGCEDTNVQLATEAGLEALQAVTLSDEEVKAMAFQSARKIDATNQVAPAGHVYSRRLSKLVGDNYTLDGFTFNYKVYLGKEVNAFAMADGTIRVYSGLMNMLDDDELRFVIGHEMGHVVLKHIKKKIMLAYTGSAVRKGIASQENITGEIARSALGGLAEQLLNAQFSQQEEREADDYGIRYLQKEGHDIGAAVTALQKLATLGAGHSFLSSHPAPEARARRLQQKIDFPEKMDEPTVFEKAVNLLKKLLSYLIDLLQELVR